MSAGEISVATSLSLPFKKATNTEDNDCANNIEGVPSTGCSPRMQRNMSSTASTCSNTCISSLSMNIGIPLFFSELKRDLKSMKEPNLIYPATDDVFVHIFYDPNDVRNYLHPD